jgi:hypothetical protein
MGSVPFLGPLTVRAIHEKSAQFVHDIFHHHESTWPQGVAVEQFFQDITEQGMAALMLHRVKHKLPVALRDRLYQTSLAQAAASLILEYDIRQLLQALAEQDIKALLLKGAALSFTLYPEACLRPHCDVDILISESQCKESVALLERLGYQAAHGATARYISSQRTYCKIRQGIYCAYDLHWHVSNSNRRFSTRFIQEGLLAEPQAIPALGPHAFTLNGPASLIYACFHRAGHFSHCGDRLIWLYDIHLLSQSLTSEEIEKFCKKVKSLGIHTLAADAIRTAQYWFATDLPPALDSFIHNLPEEEEVFTLLLREGRQQGIKNHALLEMQALATWRQRAAFLFQNAFPPAEYMLWRYGSTKHHHLPFLYLRRFAEALRIFLRFTKS